MSDPHEFIWQFGKEHRGLPISQLTHGYLTRFVNKVSTAVAGEDHHVAARAELKKRSKKHGVEFRRAMLGTKEARAQANKRKT